MKKILIIAIIILIISCQEKHKNLIENSKTSTENFDWLLGNWQRNNEKEGKQTFENWKKKNNSEYLGLGFTLQNNDTIWSENIKLIKSNENWDFEVRGKGESKPTIFKLTKIEKEKFTCENEMNEFPKKIVYFKNGDKIKAIIYGGDMEIPFEFERLIKR